MIIYANSPVSQWHVATVGLEAITDFDVFINSTDSKISVFHVPYPYDRGHGEAFETMLDQAIACSDRVVVLCSELHDDTVLGMKRDNPKVKYFLCGFADDIYSNPWMDFFTTTGYFYKRSEVLNQLTPYSVKSKTFDILLGRPKPHRDFVYNFIKQHQLEDQAIMTYMNEEIIPQGDTKDWIWEDAGLELIESDIKWTVSQVRYYGHEMSLSQVVPIKVYNQTAYTVVCETNFSNHYSFYTEKIVKPILAERLFIVFSGQYYLRNLRGLGFKTFDGIIDESYDDIEDFDERFKVACEQIKYLMTQSQEDILAKIRPITEHNKRVMLATEWSPDYFKLLRDFLLDRKD